ncbi:MAG: SpoIIE family protein phosphatase [Leptospiraceae bacterium]|nr:SpoIIE family protein phosphatase [Leptospiraceae bacterium]MDW8306233.1 SpoIIE family protein phosphatase [Leptospiraceae bacterium]
MHISIRTKFVLTLVAIAVLAAVPLSLYILREQEKEKIEATLAIGKGNTRLLALSMLDVFLKSGGQIESMRIDAIEAINVFRDQVELGLVFGQTIMVNDRNFGTVMASLDLHKEKSEENKKEEKKNLKLPRELVQSYFAFQENHRGQCLNDELKPCYNFAHVAYYEKFPVVLSVMSISEEHVLAPIKRLRQLIYISASIAVLISIMIGVGASQFITNPILALVDAVRRYSSGDRQSRVHIKVRDELQTLGEAFNEMAEEIARQIKEIEDHRDNLELKVQERTKQLQEALDAVRKLKEQQDADYFLTTFLFKPLCVNNNNSKFITTDFYIKQKKEFEWRSRKNEIGGDISITANLLFQEGKEIHRYILITNADAMGKSLQGVGGAIVFGTALNTIIASSTAGGRALSTPPKAWLERVWRELHQIFLSFNGSMMASAAFLLINEHTGQAFYLNAEHPYLVLYRDGVAGFVEEGHILRKLGAEIPVPERAPILEFQVYPQDILYLGSDGRDDLAFGYHSETGERIINEDETLFLKNIEKAKGDLSALIREIQQSGEITDDLSLVRIEVVGLNPELVEAPRLSHDLLGEKLKHIRQLINERKIYIAISELENLAALPNFRPNGSYYYLYGLCFLAQKDYQKSRELLERAEKMGLKHKGLYQSLAKIYEKLKENELQRRALEMLATITSKTRQEDEPNRPEA